MRTIAFEHISKTIETLCVAACHELPPDVVQALERAAGKESNPRAAALLRQLLENARFAVQDMVPLCQDTGLTVVFVEQGTEVAIAAPGGPGRQTLVDAINEGVKVGYGTGYLRKSIVADPLRSRANTGTNTPAIVHLSLVPGDRLKLTVIAKGGGCENKSQFRMFRPTAEPPQVADWIVEVIQNAGADACPPYIVGVGLGGNFEYSCLLSKKALLRRLDEPNADPFYAQMERDLLARINALGLGPQGLGGDTTAMAVHIESAYTHITQNPVAINTQCWPARRARARMFPDGRVEYGF